MVVEQVPEILQLHLVQLTLAAAVAAAVEQIKTHLQLLHRQEMVVQG